MKVLVTGATGFVGNVIVEKLHAKGYAINALSTRKNASVNHAQTFYWNPSEYVMDEAALDGVEAIIQLAGASVSKRWTPQYKQEIYDSRMQTAETLFSALEKSATHTVKTYVSANAVGYYPSDLEKTYHEDAEPANDFLGQVCQHWQAASRKMERLDIRVSTLRIGIVLGKGNGVLGQLEPFTKLALGAPLASGKQWMSWIHVSDLADLFIYAVENEKITGPLNAGGPNPVTNKELSKTLAKVMGTPFWAPAVPAFALKLVLGEMASIALMSQKVSDAKTKELGFNYQFKTLEEALKDIYQE